MDLIYIICISQGLFFLTLFNYLQYYDLCFGSAGRFPQIISIKYNFYEVGGEELLIYMV